MKKILFILLIAVMLISSNCDSVESLTDTLLNQIPVAKAGSDVNATLNQTVQLDGSESVDANGDELFYTWILVSKPNGSNATLSNASIVNPNITVDVAGEYSVSLIVNDGKANSQVDLLSIKVSDNQQNTNHGPIANAGNNQTVQVNSTVQLDGSLSSDADNDSITYHWNINSRPEGSNAQLNDSSIVNPSFLTDMSGDYEIELYVNDGKVNSEAVFITITVNSGTTTGPKGATLLNVISTGLRVDSHHFGISLYNGDFYLTAYSTNQITKVNESSQTLVSGYPKNLASANLPHGIYVNDDGNVYMCDLNNSYVRKYDSSMNLVKSINFEVASQPVNALKVNDKLFVAERYWDKMYVVDLATDTIERSFQINHQDNNSAAGYSDMFVYNGKLYFTSTETNGFIKMDLNGENQELITVSEISEGSLGIYVKDDKVYINTGESIIVTDLSGTKVNEWNLDFPQGFDGHYIDIEIVNDKIYIPSGWGIIYETNKKEPHILVYQEN